MADANVQAANPLLAYLPILIQLMQAAGIGLSMIVMSWFLGKRKFSRSKMQAYECGIDPTGDAQHRFSVKYYLVGMLFILFDVEAIFMVPWAVVYRDLFNVQIQTDFHTKYGGPKEWGMFGYWEMLIYIGIVLIGFWYVWKKGVFDWNVEEPGEGKA